MPARRTSRRATPVARAAAAALIAAAVAPAAAPPLAAQGPVALTFFGAENEGLPRSPGMGGLAVSSYTGPFGVRVGGGMNLSEVPDRDDPGDALHLAAWSADVDAIFAPFRGGAIIGFSPYAFAGLGGQGTRFRHAPDTSVATWSYGFGAHRRLFGALGIEGEARRRTPIERDEDRALRDDFGRGWEYRLGATISFGGSRGRRYHASRSPAPRHPARAPSHRRGGRSGLAAGVMREGERHVGTRYRYGGDSPREGFDCSGFVQYVYGREGVRLPRTSRQQAAIGEAVSPSLDDLRDGDLVFFASAGRGIDHVAIYAGDGRILHSTSSGGGVRYDRLDDGARGAWFRERMVAARRVGAGGASWAPRASWSAGDDELDPPDRAPAPR